MITKYPPVAGIGGLALPEALRKQWLADRTNQRVERPRHEVIACWNQTLEWYLSQVLPAVAPTIPPSKWKYAGGALGWGALGHGHLVGWSIQPDSGSQTLDHTRLFRFGRKLEEFVAISEPYGYDGGGARLVNKGPFGGNSIIEERPLQVLALPKEASAHWPGVTDSVVIAPEWVLAQRMRAAA